MRGVDEEESSVLKEEDCEGRGLGGDEVCWEKEVLDEEREEMEWDCEGFGGLVKSEKGLDSFFGER